MISKTDFIAQLDKGAASVPELALSSALLKELAAQLRAGEPRWWLQAQGAWKNRSFVAWSEAWGLLLSSIHYEVIADEGNPLNAVFPSCGGSFKGELGPATALSGFEESFITHLSGAQRRYYSEALARAWHIPAMHFQQRGLSYYLVEFGAGAGLNLASDKTASGNMVDPDFIEARIGLDERSLSLETMEHVRWLAACILPDQNAVLAALDKAINRVKALLKADPSFMQLVECPTALQPAYIAKNIPVEEDVGLLVFNISLTGRMSNADYAGFLQEMLKLLTPWGDRAFWLEVENQRDKEAGTVLQYRLNKVDKGLLRCLEVSRADFSAKKSYVDLQRTLDFLGVPLTKRRKIFSAWWKE